MHEVSLARQLLGAVLAHAERANARRVTHVMAWFAETESLQPESLAFHFRALAEQTSARDARLDLSVTHIEARCSACAHVYQPEHHLTLCPECGSTQATLLGEAGFGIESIDVE